MLDVGLDAIRRQLANRAVQRYEGPAPDRWAAVATVLRPGKDGAEVLLIRRAERAGDPWSGHIAFPGGHREPGDLDLLATARRETQEEVGLDLRPQNLIGALDEHAVTALGRFMGMVIAPYVFAVDEARPHLVPNHEVGEVIWAPLGPITRGEVSATKEFVHQGHSMTFPGYRVGDHVLWGLTHRMLNDLLDILAGRAARP